MSCRGHLVSLHNQTRLIRRSIDICICFPLARSRLVLWFLYLGQREFAGDLHKLSANKKGTSFVSWPRLNPPHEILSYNGPGAHSLRRGRGLTVAKMIPFFDREKGAMNVALGHGRKVEEVELGKRKGALID